MTAQIPPAGSATNTASTRSIHITGLGQELLQPGQKPNTAKAESHAQDAQQRDQQLAPSGSPMPGVKHPKWLDEEPMRQPVPAAQVTVPRGGLDVKGQTNPISGAKSVFIMDSFEGTETSRKIRFEYTGETSLRGISGACTRFTSSIIESDVQEILILTPAALESFIKSQPALLGVPLTDLRLLRVNDGDLQRRGIWLRGDAHLSGQLTSLGTVLDRLIGWKRSTITFHCHLGGDPAADDVAQLSEAILLSDLMRSPNVDRRDSTSLDASIRIRCRGLEHEPEVSFNFHVSNGADNTCGEPRNTPSPRAPPHTRHSLSHADCEPDIEFRVCRCHRPLGECDGGFLAGCLPAGHCGCCQVPSDHPCEQGCDFRRAGLIASACLLAGAINGDCWMRAKCKCEWMTDGQAHRRMGVDMDWRLETCAPEVRYTRMSCCGHCSPKHSVARYWVDVPIYNPRLIRCPCALPRCCGNPGSTADPRPVPATTPTTGPAPGAAPATTRWPPGHNQGGEREASAGNGDSDTPPRMPQEPNHAPDHSRMKDPGIPGGKPSGPDRPLTENPGTGMPRVERPFVLLPPDVAPLHHPTPSGDTKKDAPDERPPQAYPPASSPAEPRCPPKEPEQPLQGGRPECPVPLPSREPPGDSEQPKPKSPQGWQPGNQPTDKGTFSEIPPAGRPREINDIPLGKNIVEAPMAGKKDDVDQGTGTVLQLSQPKPAPAPHTTEGVDDVAIPGVPGPAGGKMPRQTDATKTEGGVSSDPKSSKAEPSLGSTPKKEENGEHPPKSQAIPTTRPSGGDTHSPETHVPKPSEGPQPVTDPNQRPSPTPKGPATPKGSGGGQPDPGLPGGRDEDSPAPKPSPATGVPAPVLVPSPSTSPVRPRSPPRNRTPSTADRPELPSSRPTTPNFAPIACPPAAEHPVSPGSTPSREPKAPDPSHETPREAPLIPPISPNLPCAPSPDPTCGRPPSYSPEPGPEPAYNPPASPSPRPRTLGHRPSVDDPSELPVPVKLPFPSAQHHPHSSPCGYPRPHSPGPCKTESRSNDGHGGVSPSTCGSCNDPDDRHDSEGGGECPPRHREHLGESGDEKRCCQSAPSRFRESDIDLSGTSCQSPGQQSGRGERPDDDADGSCHTKSEDGRDCNCQPRSTCELRTGVCEGDDNYHCDHHSGQGSTSGSRESVCGHRSRSGQEDYQPCRPTCGGSSDSGDGESHLCPDDEAEVESHRPHPTCDNECTCEDECSCRHGHTDDEEYTCHPGCESESGDCSGLDPGCVGGANNPRVRPRPVKNRRRRDKKAVQGDDDSEPRFECHGSETTTSSGSRGVRPRNRCGGEPSGTSTGLKEHDFVVVGTVLLYYSSNGRRIQQPRIDTQQLPVLVEGDLDDGVVRSTIAYPGASVVRTQLVYHTTCPQPWAQGVLSEILQTRRDLVETDGQPDGDTQSSCQDLDRPDLAADQSEAFAELLEIVADFRGCSRQAARRVLAQAASRMAEETGLSLAAIAPDLQYFLEVEV